MKLELKNLRVVRGKLSVRGKRRAELRDIPAPTVICKSANLPVVCKLRFITWKLACIQMRS